MFLKVDQEQNRDMENKSTSPKTETYTLNVLKFEYNHDTNKTAALIETDEFTQWFDMSGRVSQVNFVRAIRFTIERLIAEVR
jgi:hypothetical protein